jgi:hypothetical protein
VPPVDLGLVAEFARRQRHEAITDLPRDQFAAKRGRM